MEFKTVLNSIFIYDIYKHFYAFKKLFIGGFCLLILSSLIQLSIPVFLGKKLEIITINYVPKDYIFSFTSICTLLLLQLVLSLIRDYLFINFSEKSIASLRMQAFIKYTYLPLSFHNNTAQGSLVSIINTDIGTLKEIFSLQLSKFLYSIIILIFSIVILIQINYLIVVMILAAISISLLIIALFRKKIKSLSSDIHSKYAKLYAHMEEILANIKIVKLFNKETYEQERIKKHFTSIIKRNIKNIFIQSSLSIISSFILIILFLIIFSLFVYLIHVGKIKTAQIVVFSINTIFIINAVLAIITYLNNLQKAKGSVDHLLKILSYEDEFKGEHVGDLNIKNSLTLKDVNFSYKNGATFNKLNLSIKKPYKMAIIGKNGSGKSTLMNIIAGLYPITNGNVLIDQVSVKFCIAPAYRSLFSLVSQDDLLFNETIDYNVRYGSNQENIVFLNEIKAICGINEFEEEGKFVGKNGILLSGGQRQKILLARALYADREILILDEYNSAMDSDSKERIVKYLLTNKYLNKKTLIFLTHDSAILELMDKIVLLKDCHIAAIGNHKALIENSEDYMELYRQSI